MNRRAPLAAIALGLLPFATGAPARAEVVQSDPDNVAFQCSAGGGSPDIEQIGRKNLAVQVQEEGENRGVIRQRGERNTAVQRQSGRNNSAVIRQTDAPGPEGNDTPSREASDKTIIHQNCGRN